MKRALMLSMMTLVACGTEAPDAGRAPDASVLMEADRAFNDDVAEGGSEAWASWFAEDGAIIQEQVGEILGRENVRAAVASLDVPGVSLTWDPIRAEIAASGDLGWTTGGWVSEATGPDGNVITRQGRYVSIWRLEEDGSWKVVMDLGNPTEDPDSGG